MKNLTAKTIGLALVMTVLTSSPALPAMAVIDATAIGKLTDQLSKMQKQIEGLTNITNKIQDQINAIGKMGQITLPMLNVAKIGSRLRQDLQCLKPDFSKLMPNIEFKDIELNSICQASTTYKDTLFINPKDLVKLPTWKEREDAVKVVEVRRRNVLEDVTTKGLAQGDIAAKDVEHLNKAADDLESSVVAATTSNERLAVIAQGQVLIARAMGQQTQILAQLLKVQSAFALQAGVTVESDLVDPKKKKGPGK